jgi:hypothetical protein
MTDQEYTNYWNQQFANDPEMQQIHRDELARDLQSRRDARASGRGGRRGLGVLSESDKETAATARARAMGWVPLDHDWSVDFTDTGFRTEKRNILDRNKAGLAQLYAAGVVGLGAVAPYLTGGAAVTGTAAQGAPLLASSSPYLTAATTAVPSVGASAAGATALPFINPAYAAISAAPAAGATVGGSTAAGTGMTLGGLARKVGDWASTDTAEAVGKVVGWGADYLGQKKQDEILQQDKAVADQRYEARLALLATQRTEDLALDADREKRLQARWQAEQDRSEAIWSAREAQMEPYRVAGQQSLARVANLQTPTRTPYRSRYMG